MASLPTPRHLITSLISSIPTPATPQTEAANPLPTTAETKDLFLTLHILFQHELLPALDLLDRGLVTRLRSQTDRNLSTTEETTRLGLSPAYYVRSAQRQATPRGGNSGSRYWNADHPHATYYEVRLEPWSCSCPAFAFSAFPSTSADTTAEQEAVDHVESNVNPHGWEMGGLSLGSEVPICKHLLACVLVEHGNAFSDMVEERMVSMEELAGQAAGWGD
ncbi:SWIM zinc finger protein [Teratosphaeria destructans]|uniref:SWIM zinc finger protein n=1 Tax=Teratosphaeria destructans TaxID=418781 RepID=A0A9W7W6Q1_9PEZI|nr:SWIM zinc finger protein [Teratosphaeria destructans]